MEEKNKKIAKIGPYTGYRHNEYDSYSCTWGVLSALGATGHAFDDHPSDEFDKRWENDRLLDDDDFRREILMNLDHGFNTVKDLQFGESCLVTEYWANTKITIEFVKLNDGLKCCIDDQWFYTCEIV